MKKLRILLLFSCFVILLRCILITQNDIYHSHYNNKITNFRGIVESYHIKEDRISLIIKGKEKVQVIYYLKEGEKFFPSLGDKYDIVGEFSTISPNTNFNLFNYQKYMRSKKIYWQCQASKLVKISNHKNGLYHFKNWIKQHISNYKSSTYMELFLLGDKTNLDKTILKSYQANGISHLFAISGMHITLFTLILTKILSHIISNEKICFSILTCFLGFYLFLADFQPSLVRSVLLFIILACNKHLPFKFTSLEIIFYLFFLFLLVNAYYIYNVGFLFSFLITFSLISCTKIINRRQGYFSKLFITSCISFLVSIPLVIQNYFSLNFLTPLLNCIFVPFVSMVIFPLTLITLIFPFLDSILIYLIKVLEYISLFFQKFSFLTFIFSKCSIIFVIIYYLIIIFILYKIYLKKYRYILILIMILIIHYFYPYFNFYPKITMIDVGQGDSTLIELPHQQENILIDTGGKVTFKNKNDTFQIAQNTLIPYLHSIGIKRLDYLILTHGDQDHLGEAEYLIKNFPIRHILFNSGKNNYKEQKLIKILHKRKISYNTISKAKIKIHKYTFCFLNDQDKENENEDSLVLYTKLNQHNILLMGDAGEKSEEYIIKKYSLPKIDILKLGHHGSKFSTSTSFLNKVNPRYAFISCGKNNRFNHPSEETLTRLKDKHIIYYRTDLHGMIKIILKSKIEIKTVFQSLP